MISVLLFTSFHSASRSIFRIQGLPSPSWSITTNSMATKHLLYLLHTKVIEHGQYFIEPNAGLSLQVSVRCSQMCISSRNLGT